MTRKHPSTNLERIDRTILNSLAVLFAEPDFDNDDGEGDIVVSAEDKLKNLHVLGSISVDEAAVGDEVLLLGSQGDGEIEFDELAAWFGMSGLDTAMALSDRLPSHYREG